MTDSNLGCSEEVETKNDDSPSFFVLDSVPLGGGKLDTSAQKDKWNNKATVHDGKNIPNHGRYRTYSKEDARKGDADTPSGLRVQSTTVPSQEGIFTTKREARRHAREQVPSRSAGNGLCWDKYQNVWVPRDEVLRGKGQQDRDYTSKVRQRPVRRSGMKWDRRTSEWVDPAKPPPPAPQPRVWNRVKSAWADDKGAVPDPEGPRNVVASGESAALPPSSPVRWCRTRSEWVDRDSPTPARAPSSAPRHRNKGRHLHQGGSANQYFVASADADEWRITDSLPMGGAPRRGSPRRRRFFTTHRESGGLFVYVKNGEADDGGKGATVKQALSFQDGHRAAPAEGGQRRRPQQLTTKIGGRGDRFLQREEPAKRLPRGYVLYESQVVLG